MFFRSLIGAGVIAGATLIGTAATASADPPNCTAADLAGVMSGVNAAMSAPRKYGSILAVTKSSLSPRPKLRGGGPTSPPDGTKPLMTKLLGSRDVRA